MNIQDQLHDAIEVVLNWDIPDEAVSEAIVAQAGFMARVSADELRSGRYS